MDTVKIKSDNHEAGFYTQWASMVKDGDVILPKVEVLKVESKNPTREFKAK